MCGLATLFSQIRHTCRGFSKDPLATNRNLSIALNLVKNALTDWHVWPPARWHLQVEQVTCGTKQAPHDKEKHHDYRDT